MLQHMLDDLFFATARSEKERVVRRYVDEKLLAPILEDLEKYNALLRNGKGTWPNQGYVKDETWAGWVAASQALARAAGVIRGFRDN